MITPQEVYPKLFKVLCKMKKIHYAEWKDFMSVSEIIQFKANERIIEAGTPSTHSYFIISGLIMCYKGSEAKNITWFRAEGDYAFLVDMFSTRKSIPNDHYLVALEDTVVVGISHKDLSWICDKHKDMYLLSTGYMHHYSRILNYIWNCSLAEPRERYEWIQRLLGFKLSRVPDLYLARYAGFTAKQLKVLRKDTHIDFLRRY